MIIIIFNNSKNQSTIIVLKNIDVWLILKKKSLDWNRSWFTVNENGALLKWCWFFVLLLTRFWSSENSIGFGMFFIRLGIYLSLKTTDCYHVPRTTQDQVWFLLIFSRGFSRIFEKNLRYLQAMYTYMPVIMKYWGLLLYLVINN